MPVYQFGPAIATAISNNNKYIDINIQNIILEMALNILTFTFLDLTPKIKATMKPMSIKAYKQIGSHSPILANTPSLPITKTISAAKNKTNVKMIG